MTHDLDPDVLVRAQRGVMLQRLKSHSQRLANYHRLDEQVDWPAEADRLLVEVVQALASIRLVDCST